MKAFIKFTIDVYGKSHGNVRASVGDNYFVTQSIEGATGRGFVGCSSHRFNPAMKTIIEEHMD